MGPYIQYIHTYTIHTYMHTYITVHYSTFLNTDMNAGKVFKTSKGAPHVLQKLMNDKTVNELVDKGFLSFF